MEEWPRSLCEFDAFHIVFSRGIYIGRVQVAEWQTRSQLCRAGGVSRLISRDVVVAVTGSGVLCGSGPTKLVLVFHSVGVFSLCLVLCARGFLVTCSTKCFCSFCREGGGGSVARSAKAKHSSATFFSAEKLPLNRTTNQHSRESKSPLQSIEGRKVKITDRCIRCSLTPVGAVQCNWA